MDETTWLTCADPQQMLEFLKGKVSERKLRLCLCGIYSKLPSAGLPENVKRTVGVQERYADGLVTMEELLAARSRANDSLARQHQKVGTRAPLPSEEQARRDGRATAIAKGTTHTLAGIVYLAIPAWRKMNELKGWGADVVRDTFGDPFKAITINAAWLTSNVVELARTIYDDCAFDRMPILGDALENAGCDNAEILNHCRGENVHVRGCWCIDLILGKS